MKKLITNIDRLHQTPKLVTLRQGLAIGRELLTFIKYYNRTRLVNIAVGLSANQLGIDAAVCVLMLKPEVVLVNPQIITHSHDTFQSIEGCLSLPGIKVEVPRYIWVEVIADNMKGKRIFGVDLTRISGKPYDKMLGEAAIAQHEIGHTQGKLITDYK